MRFVAMGLKAVVVLAGVFYAVFIAVILMNGKARWN